VGKAKDGHARAVGDDSNLDVLLAPVFEDGPDVAGVVDRDEETLGLGVELAEALARLADDGRVNAGRDLEEVGVDERVKEPDVVAAELGEEQVLLDARRLGPKLMQGANLLLVERLVRAAGEIGVGVSQRRAGIELRDEWAKW
jgi:hypothetical protein